MAVAVAYPHIDHTEAGVPFVKETGTKVEQIALDQIAYGWSADEIHRNHPYLSLAPIHCALAYYYDNQAQMDARIEAGLRFVNEFRERQGETSVRLKLKAKGFIY